MRTRYMEVLLSLLGKVVVWGGKGPDYFDCSGSVTFSAKQAGAKDVTQTWNANALFEHGKPVLCPRAGDLCFWSYTSHGDISHVATAERDAQMGEDLINSYPIISADGATPAVKLEMAKESASCRVRRHDSVASTGRMYFRGFRTNPLLED